jgi:hypothetical protein
VPAALSEMLLGRTERGKGVVLEEVRKFPGIPWTFSYIINKSSLVAS